MVYLYALLALSSALTSTEAQILENGCMRLIGSVACPGFSYAYLSPGNLSNAFPFFSTVTDVRSFDAAALGYFSNQYQFEQTKFVNQLGCSNASNAVLRYERTVLCSSWVNSRWSLNCLALYNGTSSATSQKMVCQNTCLDYAASEYAIVNNTLENYCPGPDLTNGRREATLLKDFADCTNWFTLATNNSATCVNGTQNGELNCGFGSSTLSLCDFCRGSNPDSCCYAGDTDMSVCGYTLPVRINLTTSSSSSSAQPTSSATQAAADNGDSTGLSRGQLAGIIVGSILGGILLLALLILLLLYCLRRRRNKAAAAGTRNSSDSTPVDTSERGKFASLLTPIVGSGIPNNQSEKGLLGNYGQGAAGAASTPTMGGDTLYGTGGSQGAPSTHGVGLAPALSNSATAGAGAGLGAALGFGAVGAGAAGMNYAGDMNGPGMRNSGIVLPRVRDENQNGEAWIETGAEVTVLWPYQASLPDELDLRSGMKLRVLRLYDDAWGTAIIVGGGEGGEMGKQGAFPIVCVSEGSSLGSSRPNSDLSH